MGAWPNQPFHGGLFIWHLHVEVRPVLARLGLGHLLQQQPRLGVIGIPQDG